MNRFQPELKDLHKYAAEYRRVPVWRELNADSVTPILLLRRLAKGQTHFFLLESIPDGQTQARFSFLGAAPICRMTCRGGVVTRTEKGVSRVVDEAPYEALRTLMKAYRAPRIEGLPPFTGGLVGYFGYGMSAVAEPVLRLPEGELPDYDLSLFEQVIAFDHLQQKVFLIANIQTDDLPKRYAQGAAAIAEMQTLLTQHAPAEMPSGQRPVFVSNRTPEAFADMVERAKAHIRAGDIFQAVLSRKFTAQSRDDLMGAYRVLRTTNPSPYMVFLQTGALQLVAASPETLVRVRGGRLSTFPIAGSRPRGNSPAEDCRLEQELLQDEKECSEHNMLVDLGRNDLGRISRLGSVAVTAYQQVHRYSRIMHLCSAVEGELREGLDALDAVRAVLPAGTLSGAPKIRACEIITELEQEARGIYGGALGYLDFNGDLDTCIAIRMAVKSGDTVTVQAGAGIVADSVPAREWEETANKAAAVLSAVERASEVTDEWF